LASCVPAKKLNDGEHLLTKTKIHTESGKLDKYELQDVIRQRPNKKVLWMRLYLTFYNWSTPEGIARRRSKKELKLNKKNERRAARGAEPKELKRNRKEWWQEDVGEPPVILDTSLVRRSTEQLQSYLYKEGYFNGTVHSEILYHKKKRAKVIYTINEGTPFAIGRINYSVADIRMRGIIEEELGNMKIESGTRFDMDKLEAERDRVNGLMLETGYFYFPKSAIAMRVDTLREPGVGDIEVTLLDDNGQPLKSGEATQVYNIEDIYVNADRSNLAPTDTTVLRDYHFLHTGKERISSHSLLTSMFVKPGQLYNRRNIDNTYKRLTGLRSFQRVEISFDTTGTSGPGLLDARLRLLPAKQQSVSVEGYGTNRGGFLGTSVSFSYLHKNLFRGMENLELKMNLGLEAQQSITGDNSAVDNSTTAVGNDVLFNTLELGPELTLRFPTFLIPFVKQESFARSTAPRTILKLQYSFQRRPDFTRSLTRVSFGYEWNESRYKRWGLFPLEVNEVRLPSISDAFRDYLQEVNDPVLTDSYTDHFIVGARGAFTFNTQDTDRKKRYVWYSRTDLETSGNFLRLLFNVTNKDPVSDTTASGPYYDFAGIRFAQYVKVSNDLRLYRHFHERSSLVFRTAAGAGLPLKNLDALPFETSFFVGGANGLRAWRARSIGPGSYSEPLTTFDRIGEIKLEGNVEYRFGLIGFIEGALFADAGNIWFFKENRSRPGSAISADFLSELAIGTGFGTRLNFDYFIVRFDFGLQTKDPSLPKGERWLWQPKDQYEAYVSGLTGTDFQYKPVVNFNLGIGYPF
jgi:outer membrane translocation and assembly module TamA